MTHHRLPLLATATLSLLTLAGCPDREITNPSADAAAIRARIRTAVPPIVDGAERAAASASEAAPALDKQLADLASLALGPRSPLVTDIKANVASSSPDSRLRLVQLVHETRAALIKDPTVRETAPIDGPPSLPKPSRGDELARYLDTKVFTDANDHDGRFKLPVELFCGETPELDCAARWELADLEMSATLVGKDGIDLAVLTGSDHHEAIVISMSRKQAQLSVDLDALQPAISAMFDDGGNKATVSGVLTADFALWADDDFTAHVAIDEPVHVAITNGPTFDVAAAQPAFSLHLDGPRKSIVAAATFGEIKLATPASADEPKTPAKAYDLPGLTFAATVRAGQPLIVQALSLGQRTATISVGGQVAASLDLNANDGRKVDLTFDEETDTAATVIEAAPRLDVQLAIDYAKLGETAPATQVTRALLDAAGGTLGALRVTADELQVVGGTLTIETNPAGGGGVFPSGTCVSDDFHVIACDQQTK